MMSDQTDNLAVLLSSLGISTDEARIYLFLLQSKHHSALDISRKLRMGRTKVYRLLDKLTDKGIVNSKLGEMGLIFGANDPQTLNLLIAEEESRLTAIKQQSESIITKLNTLIPESQTDSEVKYYNGAEGLKQVTLNSLKANKDLYIYEVNQDMSSFIDQEFAETIRKKFAERGIKTYQLTNKKRIKAHTKIAEHVKNWEIRYVNPNKLRIDFEVLLYNDVYALYSVKENEMFCVEIHNPYLAKMQKQIFNHVWTTAIPMKKLDDFGSAEV